MVADFSLAGTRVGAQHGGSDLSAWFDNGGEWYMTQTDIPFTMLPEAVRTAFAATEYAAVPWSVDDVDMLEREGVETVYVIEVEKYDNGRETEIDLYYPLTVCWSEKSPTLLPTTITGIISRRNP